MEPEIEEEVDGRSLAEGIESEMGRKRGKIKEWGCNKIGME